MNIKQLLKNVSIRHITLFGEIVQAIR